MERGKVPDSSTGSRRRAKESELGPLKAITRTGLLQQWQCSFNHKRPDSCPLLEQALVREAQPSADDVLT